MKKFLFTTLCVLLVAVMAFALVACGGEKEPEKATVNTGDPKTNVSIYKAEKGDYPELKNQVSWDGINSVPIKKAGMSIAEARQICADFFTYAKTATWIPSENYGIWSDATIHTDGSNPDRHMDGGVIYGGLPYISWGTGSIYRLMDYIDETTGVVDMKNAGNEPLVFGNQCANGAYVGFCRVINSADYGVTADMVHSRGFLRIGDYKYADYLTGYSEGYNTTAIIKEKENGEQVLFRSYAQQDIADGLVNWTTAGHVMMVVSKPVVVYKESDPTKIDGSQSYLYITDQHVQFNPYQHPDGGDLAQIANYVNRKFTFQQLLDASYLPFTFAEWTGADPIEQTECGMTVGSTTYAKGTIAEDENRTFQNTAADVPTTLSVDQLFKVKVTSNYFIMDLYAEVYNADGVQVYKLANRPLHAGNLDFQFAKAGNTKEEWGSLENLDLANYDYTVKIYMQLATGERPVLWEGKLTPAAAD
jgi:hypothetical protein